MFCIISKSETYRYETVNVKTNQRISWKRVFNLLSAYDVISSHAISVMLWSVGLNTSCCSSGLTQNL